MKHVCDVYVAFVASAAFANVSSFNHATLVHALLLLDVVDAFDTFDNAPIIEYVDDATSPCIFIVVDAFDALAIRFIVTFKYCCIFCVIACLFYRMLATSSNVTEATKNRRGAKVAEDNLTVGLT